MKVKIIGCGNAFSNRNSNQSFLLEENENTLLIDCGTRTPSALADAGVKIADIKNIYVSHGHADHVGGLEEVAFLRYDWSKRPTKWDQGNYAPKLIGNVAFLQDLWEHSLKGGLQSMEGFEATLETFFEVIPIHPNQSFEWEGWNVDLIQQIHVMAQNLIMHTYGLMFKKEGHKSVYFTTDSQHCSPRQIQQFYKQADVIFQDCELIGCNFKFKEGDSYYEELGQTFSWPSDDMDVMEIIAKGKDKKVWGVYKFGSGVHANYAELAGYNSANHIQLPVEVKAKMYLSHYQDFKLDNKDGFGNSINWDTQAKLDGFAGFVHKGQEFEF